MKTNITSWKAWRVLTLAVVLGSCSSPCVDAADRVKAPVVKSARLKPVDVRLNGESALMGRVVDAQGKPQAEQSVELWSQGHALGSCQTDEQGRFRFDGLKTGVYQVTSGGSGGSYRIWTADVAPPAAKHQVMIVQDGVVRAQGEMPGVGSGLYGGSVMHALSNPWVFAGAVGAGIAIPLALDHNDGS